jgi:hypothetical protein
VTKRLLAAANERVNVIAGEISEAHEQLEYLDIALRGARDGGSAAATDYRIA